MASYSMMHDIGSLLTVKEMVSARQVSESTAGTTVNGTILDRRVSGTETTGGSANTAGDFNDLYHSLKVAVPFNAASMTTGSTGSITFAVHHSSSTATADFSLYADIDGTTSAQSQSFSSANESGVVTADYRLDTAKRFIRVEAEATNSSTAGTITYAVSGIFGPGDQPPAN